MEHAQPFLKRPPEADTTISKSREEKILVFERITKEMKSMGQEANSLINLHLTLKEAHLAFGKLITLHTTTFCKHAQFIIESSQHSAPFIWKMRWD